MKTPSVVMLTVVLGSAFSAGCALTRQGVTGLSQEQDRYYTALTAMLTEKRATLVTGLREQLSADRDRQRQLLTWQRDLVKAEVILQQRIPTVTGEQRLVYMKLAEADLAAVSLVAALENVDEARQAAVMNLYDQLATALDKIQKNNHVILQYLESGDTAFALRSLDIDGLVRVVAEVQSARAQLNHATAQDQAAQQRQLDSIRASAEQARDILVKLYSR